MTHEFGRAVLLIIKTCHRWHMGRPVLLIITGVSFFSATYPPHMVAVIAVLVLNAAHM